jgi:mono/diheme cytochrome c family protein
MTGVARLPALVLLAALGAASPSRAEPPEILYMLQCRGCHLPDGAGTPGVVPPFAGQVGRFLTVPGGREFLVRVPGSAQSPLSDAELAEVLNWIVRRFGPDEVARSFAPYTAEEVAHVRRPPLTDVDSVRRALVAEIERAGR